jgi:hypothetical protein
MTSWQDVKEWYYSKGFFHAHDNMEEIKKYGNLQNVLERINLFEKIMQVHAVNLARVKA